MSEAFQCDICKKFVAGESANILTKQYEGKHEKFACSQTFSMAVNVKPIITRGDKRYADSPEMCEDCLWEHMKIRFKKQFKRDLEK